MSKYLTNFSFFFSSVYSFSGKSLLGESVCFTRLELSWLVFYSAWHGRSSVLLGSARKAVFWLALGSSLAGSLFYTWIELSWLVLHSAWIGRASISLSLASESIRFTRLGFGEHPFYIHNNFSNCGFAHNFF
jgi:hypothetical protein